MAGEGKFIDNLAVGNLAVDGDLDVGGTATIGDVSDKVRALTVATTLTAADSGKLITLGTAGGFAVTLPAAGAGLTFTFAVKVAPTTAYTVITPSSANIIFGAVASAEDAAGSVAVAQQSDTITFVANKAVIGDMVTVICDGTNWYTNGFCAVQDGITLTKAT